MTAAPRPVPAVGRARVPVTVLAVALLVLALWGQAAAQGARAPRVAVSPTVVAVGETVAVEADRLTPGGRYRLEIDAPSGHRQVLEAVAGDAGAIGFEVELREAGPTDLRLVGPDLDASLRVRAESAAPAPAPTPEPLAPPQSGPRAPSDAPPASGAQTAPPPAPEAEVVPQSLPGAEPPAPDAPPAPAPREAVLAEGETLRLEDEGLTLREVDGSVRWRFSRHPGSGGTRGAIVHLGRVWVAHGHAVLELDLETGYVLSRAAVSGPIALLAPLGTGVRVEAEVRVSGETRRVEHRVEGGVATPLATFDPASPLFTWWQAEADVADPGTAVRRDPTNPHLHLRVAALSDDEAEQDEAVAAALAAGGPFFERAQVARGLAALRRFDDADEAMRGALADFEARGYHPALLTDPEVHDRYGFPLRPLRRALQADDREAAALWAGWLPRTAGPGMPSAAAALREYADVLRQEDDVAAAEAARQQAAELGATSPRRILSDAAVNLGRGGWYAASALVAAALALHLTLVAKYWRLQSMLIRQARESGRRAGAAWRWRAIRHYGTTEKLSLVLLLAAAHAMAALTIWTQQGDPAVTAVASGHLTAPHVAPLLLPSEAGDTGQRGVLDAYALWRAGNEAGARVLLERAVLDGVPEAEARLEALNAGQGVPAPSPTTVRAAVAGTWSGALAEAYRNPFETLDAATVPVIPGWSASLLLAAFLVFSLFHLVLLLVPRSKLARNAPRTLGYHLLALLVPGAGATDELWGVLLLVPWAVFGIDVLVQLGWATSPLGFPLLTGMWILAALYAVNLLAWGIELSSYLRRMHDLRRDRPDLAYDFGMKPLPADV
jgi:hypothetical protein